MFLSDIFSQSDEPQNDPGLQINLGISSNQLDFQKYYFLPVFPYGAHNTSNISGDIPRNTINILDYSNMRTNYRTFTVLRKNEKKGRKKKSNNEEYYGPSHNKYKSDNLTRKLQVHYISFIFALVNIFLKVLYYHEKFYKLDYSYKKNVNKTHIDELKSLTIGELLCKEISSKYLKEKENNNIKLYKKVKDVPIIKELLSCKYLDLFHLYMKKDNLISFGNITINLTHYKIKMYKDLVNKNINDPIYLEKLEEYKEKYFAKH